MKKKILCLGVISMFLLINITAVSAVEKKSVLMSNTDDSIDIQLRVGPLFLQRDIGETICYYWADVYIKNTGAKDISNSDYPNLIIQYTAEFENSESINLIINLWEKIDDDSLDVGVGVCYRIYWQYYDNEGNRHYAKQGSLLKVFLDPENLILESNEDNNYWEEVGFKARSINLFLKTLLQTISQRFPLLQQLLKL